jgi:hypothetical protein
VRHAYDVLLRLYPDAFRRRFGVEMSLDFADGWTAARAGGTVAALAFAWRVAGDLVVSLLREWTRGPRPAIAAITAGVTAVLWGLALRPWMWKWDIQPGPPAHARTAPPVTEVELLVLAVTAMVPVVVIILFASFLARPTSVRARRGER